MDSRLRLKKNRKLNILWGYFHLSTVCQIKSFSALDNVCLFAVSLFFRQKYTHSPCDIITLSMEVYFQMSGTSPWGMSYNLRPNIRWGGEHWSDYTDYPQTVNKDQTMLSAVGFKQDVFSMPTVEIIVWESLDKPQ